MELAALALVIPLLVAACLAIGVAVIPRRVSKGAALLASLATTALCAIVLGRVGSGTEVYWFGNWFPTHGVAIGISLTVDALGAGLATFIGVLMTAALAFSWRYLDEERPYYSVMMMVFLAGMAGFCLAGDLFTLFVLLEVMSVSAYALTSYMRDQRAPLAGALNFAITNSIGSFMVLFGLGLVYGRTGALNFAQIGEALSRHHLDGLVIVAFALLVSGFFVKTAVVPFHFWLPDAYAVAPAPVCLLFAGVMSELGLYAVGRLYFASFSGVLAPHTADLTAVLLVAGSLTALLGAVMAFRQDHLTRLLGFATVSSIGIFVIGAGLLADDGVAGSALYLVGDGFAKASLFCGVGVLQHRFGTVSERRMRGLGRELPATGAMFALAGLAIAALPPFGPFLGKSMLEDALLTHGYGWALAVIVVATALTGGAILRAAGRVFLGLGPEERRKISRADRETEPEAAEVPEGSPPMMILVTAALLLGALLAGAWFGLADAVSAAATHFTDGDGYAAAVFGGPHAPPAASPSDAPRWFDWLLAAATLLGALGIAALALFYPRLGARRMRRLAAPGDAVLDRLDALHSGHVGDYVAWLTVGLASFGVTFGMLLR